MPSEPKDNSPSAVIDSLASIRVTVVMPAYNSERFLQAAVDSVVAQTFTSWELIIVDDGSTDGTLSIAQKIAERNSQIRIISQNNQGVSQARNRGVEESSTESEYIAFLDSDDIWLPATLEYLVRRLEISHDAEAVYGLGQYVDTEGDIIPGEALETWAKNRLEIIGNQRKIVKLERPTTFEMLSVRNYICIGAIVMRRSAYKELGGFKLGLLGMEDWHLWVRLAQRYPIEFVNRIVFHYRRHDSNKTNHRANMDKEHFYSTRDLYENCLGEGPHREHFLRSQPIKCQISWIVYNLKLGRLRRVCFHFGVILHNLVYFQLIQRGIRGE